MPKKTKKSTKAAPKPKAAKVPECTSSEGHRTVAMGHNEDGSFNVKCNECNHEWTSDVFDG